MSVNPADCITVLKADGVGKTFDFTFRQFIKPSGKHSVDVKVLKSDGTYTTFTEGTDYTVSWHPQGGTILFNVAPAKDLFVIMSSNLEMTQDHIFEIGQFVDGRLFTEILDEITMKILQVECQASNAVQSSRDPVTGKIYSASLGTPVPDKVLTYDSAGKVIISSSYSIEDLKSLAHAVDAALSAANAANQTAQQSITAAQNAVTSSQQSANTATQANTDAQAAKTAAQSAANTATTTQTSITNLYTTSIKPVGDLLAPPVAQDVILAGDGNNFVKTAGKAYIESLLKQYMSSGQLIWNDAGVLKGINKIDIGGSGGGTGSDLKLIFDGQPDGSAIVSDSSATDKFSVQPVVTLKTTDIANAGKIPSVNSAGNGFVLIDPPQSEGQGADYTAPITIASAPNKLKQLKVPVADPAATPDRADKIARVTADGSDWVYESLPNTDTIVHVNGVPVTMTLDAGIQAPTATVESFQNLVLHTDPTTQKITIELGGTSMGGSSVPTPPATGLSHLGTVKVPNGNAYSWLPTKAAVPSGTADNGKIQVYNAATDSFTLETPLADTPLTRSLTGETGISGAPEVQKAAALDISIEPCILQFADPTTYATSSHDLAQTTYSITSVTDSIVWIYSDPKDSWAIKQQTTTPTLDEKLGRVYIAEVEVTGSVIRSVKPIYNELSHKEYVLREIGDAIGTTVRGARFDVAATGLKVLKDATLFSFLARRVPLTGGGVYNSSKLFFAKDAILNCYYVKKGVVNNSASTDFLLKNYVDDTGNEATLASGNTAVTIHYLYGPATFDTTTGNVTGVYLIMGNSVYDSISSAKEDAMTADAKAEVPAFISRNCALIAKLFVRFDAVSTDPASFFVLNYANLSSKSTSVIHSNVLPDTTGVVNGAVLKANNGAYMFDNTVTPLTVGSPIADGQILSVQGGVAVGIDASAVPSLDNQVGVAEKFHFAVCNVNPTGVILNNGDANTNFSGIASIDNKTSSGDLIITFTAPVTRFYRALMIIEEPNQYIVITPLYPSSVTANKVTIPMQNDGLNPWYNRSGPVSAAKFVVYYL